MFKTRVQSGFRHTICLVALLAAFPLHAQRLPQDDEDDSATGPSKSAPKSPAAPAPSAKPAPPAQVAPAPSAKPAQPAKPTPPPVVQPATPVAPEPSAKSDAPSSPAPVVQPPAPAAPAKPAGAATVADGVSYTVRLHELERQVDELKEQVFRSKARLNLLKETVLHGSIAGSHSIILHRNEMGSTYLLTRLVYALDGSEIFAKSDERGRISDTKEFEIYNGLIVPGNHTISVVMTYQGNGFGVFSYLKGYHFTVRASYTFTAVEGKTTQIKVVGYEKGNAITTDPKDRPAIEFRLNVVADRPEAPAQVKK